MLTAVTGINWGDEGKGRVIDLLAENADVVVRYQGGNNAGHTVVTDNCKFVLNLLPSYCYCTTFYLIIYFPLPMTARTIWVIIIISTNITYCHFI